MLSLASLFQQDFGKSSNCSILPCSDQPITETHQPTPSAIGSQFCVLWLIDGEVMKSRLTLLLGGFAVTVGCMIGLLPRSVVAASLTIYVDRQISSNPCTKYNFSTRSCGSGTDTAYSTIAAASAAATPGTTVLIRGGSYTEPLDPQTSGAAGQYITFKNYGGEQVFLGGETGIVLSHRRYIWVEGLHVEDRLWLESNNSDASFASNFQNRNFNVIKSCIFKRTPSSGTTGNLRFVRSHDNQILDSIVEEGNDSILLIDSQRNLVQGNKVTIARHSIWGIRCGDYNVIRNNYFANPNQKIGEVYDCGQDTRAVPNSFNSTKHNLIENNVFAETSRYYSASGGNGIQYSGQDGIIRKNAFYNGNIGLGMQRYEDEALYNTNNRVYHNVFYKNEGAGVALGSGITNNYFKNNIFLLNNGCIPDCGATSPGQVLYLSTASGGPDWATTIFSHNSILYEQSGQAVIEEAFGAGVAIAGLSSQIKSAFGHVLEVNPLFVNAAGFDFHLENNSPLIDAGDFLTKTAEAKTNSTSMRVQDAAYFYDGYGIAGEQGDLIQLQGGTTTARIVSIDYATHTLTLDRPLSWTAGQGVALLFGGNAPDIGAFETSLSTAMSPPPPPTNLRAVAQ